MRFAEKKSLRTSLIVLCAGIIIFFTPFSTSGDENAIIPKSIHVIHRDEENKNLSHPSSVFFESVKNEIYLVDAGHGRIIIYTSDFFPLYTLDKDDGITAPTCLIVDSKGYLFVGQSAVSAKSRARISVFNPSLKWKYDIFFKGFEGSDNFVPQNIALDGDENIYIAGSNYKGVVVIDKKGKYIYTFVQVRQNIRDVVIDKNGNIYLLCEAEGSVYVFNKDSELIVKFGKKGGGSGKLSRPQGLCVDTGKDRIYVVDYMRHAVNVYDINGDFLFEFGGKGWGRGWFQYPTDVCVDSKGHLLVADTFNNRVQVLEVQ